MLWQAYFIVVEQSFIFFCDELELYTTFYGCKLRMAHLKTTWLTFLFAKQNTDNQLGILLYETRF